MLAAPLTASSPSGQHCPVCQAETAADALFCPRCTAPISIATLASLTAEEKSLCMHAVAEVLAEVPAGGWGQSEADLELFSAYLSAQWLRPETALLQYAEARALASLSIPPGPRMDLGCGDGVHAALYSGFRFAQDFDCFQSLSPTSRDIYDHFEPHEFSAQQIRRGRVVDLGIDIKPTAIARAGALDVFADLQLADATSLPAANGSFSFIFSNMLRDLGETLPAALAETARVLRPSGLLAFSAMTEAYQEHLYFAPKSRGCSDPEHAARLMRLDRGRSEFCRQRISAAAWKQKLAEVGLVFEQAIPIAGQYAVRFWDVGLRPFSISLVRQAGLWRSLGILQEVKPPLVSGLEMALARLRDSVSAGAPCMHLIVARKP